MKLLTALALAGALFQVDSRVVLVRVHGNHTLPDDEVLRLAGVSRGDPFEAGDEERIRERLLESKKFESAEVRVRYRSLSESGDVALVLLVRERRSVPSRFMVGPIFDLSDEYGVTLGARLAFVELAGGKGRVGFPLSWGGKRQAGVEGQFDNVRFEFLRWREVNPHFDTPDNRLQLGGAYSAAYKHMRFDAGLRWSRVDFAELDDRFVTLGAKAVFDTRRDPTVPGNAVYAGFDWRRRFFLNESVRPDVNQYVIDLRGYKRLWGQALLAGQYYWAIAGGPLPPYEQPFLGGGKTLRGYKAGHFIGDSAAHATAELRLPLTSPLSFARGGIHFFYDTGAVYDYGESIGGARFHHGVGTGVFFRAAIIGIRLDVGWDLEGGTRFHIASSVKF